MVNTADNRARTTTIIICMYVLLFMNFAHHKLDFKTEFALLTKVNDPSKQRVHIFFLNLQQQKQ